MASDQVAHMHQQLLKDSSLVLIITVWDSHRRWPWLEVELVLDLESYQLVFHLQPLKPTTMEQSAALAKPQCYNQAVAALVQLL